MSPRIIIEKSVPISHSFKYLLCCKTHSFFQIFFYKVYDLPNIWHIFNNFFKNIHELFFDKYEK